MKRVQLIQQAIHAGLTLVPIPLGGKRPLIQGWQSDKNVWVDTQEKAEEYIKTYPHDGVGVLHSESRTCALDIDDPDRTATALAAVGINLMTLLKTGPRIKGKNGEKPLYRMPIGVSLKTVKLVVDGTIFELRGGHGVQDVLPPSIHPTTNKPYEWVGASIDDGIPELPAELLRVWQNWEQCKPAMLLALGVSVVDSTTTQELASPRSAGVESAARYVQTALERELGRIRQTGKGGRNDQLNRSAFSLGQLVGAGVLDEAEARSELLEAARSIGLPERELLATIRSGLSSGRTRPRDMSHVGRKRQTAVNGQFRAGETSAANLASALPEKPSLLDYRNLVMQQMVEQGDIYHYHQTRRSWWQYLDGVYVEIIDEVMYQRVDRILQQHEQALTTSRIREVLEKISREPEIGVLSSDEGEWDLNCKNGLLDLASGVLYDHTPAVFSTIQSAAAYKPDLVAYEWLEFLHEAVPDEPDRQLLQMYAGLCLTADTSPQRALLLIGDGGTGKGTFTRVLQAVLGQLSTSSALENIKDGSFLIGTLVARRMCVVSELSKTTDWLTFKRIVGEDQVLVDVKHKTPYAIKLDCKLVMLSNVMPFLGDDSSNTSLTRRFLPVEFNVKPKMPDPYLEARLTHPDELSGVLNWAVEGLGLLIASGMRFPETAKTITRAIVEESNKVIAFVRERTGYVADTSTTAADLYRTYRNWCEETGHRPLSQTTFGKQLLSGCKILGYEVSKGRSRRGISYSGISLSRDIGNWEAPQ